MLKLDLWKLLLDLKSIASDILRYIFEPAEWIRYIAIYFNLPSEYDTWPADKPPIYLQKSFISNLHTHSVCKFSLDSTHCVRMISKRCHDADFPLPQIDGVE